MIAQPAQLPVVLRQLSTRLPLLLIVLLSLAAGWEGPNAELLAYDRAALLAGEVWRLCSGHLVHGSLLHCLLNLLGLTLILALFGSHIRALELIIHLLLSTVLVSLMLWWWQPELQRYVGLSGVLHGLLVCYALRDARQGGWTGAAALLLLAIKLGYEQLQGASVETERLIGLPVIIDAHLYGALVGLLLALYRPASRNSKTLP